ncbi:MAG: diguanylate cyclase [Myxococcota bacterium]
MSTLVHAALTLRRTWRVSHGFVAAAVFAALDLLGVFQVDPGALQVEHALVAAAWLAIFVSRVDARFRAEEAGEAQGRQDLELGLLLLVAIHAVVQMGGGLTGDLYPLVFILVAFLASFATKPMGTVLVLAAVGLEAGLYFVTEGRTDSRAFALHSTFVVFFGLLHLLFTRVEIARVRHTSRRQLDEQKQKVAEETRLFRLVGAPSEDGGGTGGDPERVLRSSVEEVHHQLYHVLSLLQRSLDLHTCVLLMLDPGGDKLRIVELATDSDDIADGPLPVGEGAVGAVAKRGQVTNLEHLRPGYKGLCYYRGPGLVRSFLGVPVVEDGHLRGALCADRIEDRPFTAKEQEVLENAVTQVLRAMENERVFVQLQRSKREQGVLYRASQALGSALNEDDVMEAGLAAASEITPFDFAAITRYQPERRRHVVRRAVGEEADRFAGLTFRDNTSLTAMAVKTRHYLPYRGEFDSGQQVVFTRRANLRGMRSVLVLPLVVREGATGCLVLAARRHDAFGDTVRPTLQVLANQLAVSMANAAAVKRLEEMATTDGLTGCLNKRAFLEELDRKLRAAERFGRPLSLIVTDIDHFKSVNDTYGHATGDVVIKELGAILQRVKRETDVVARFGGEEFCVLCEETDTEGAKLLAERVRQELGATEFQTELGALSVTCSLGVATFPRDARDSAGLFEASDKALYGAKHGGRDQVCTAR